MFSTISGTAKIIDLQLNSFKISEGAFREKFIDRLKSKTQILAGLFFSLTLLI